MSSHPRRFATLTPENDLAQKCLASLVDQQQQLHPVSRIDHVAAIRVSPTTASPLTATNHRAAQSRYHLDLSFDIQGLDQDGAWVVGKSGTATVDLPICSSRSRLIRQPQVCSIFIHPQSGLLMIRNINTSQPITYLQADGQNDVVLHDGDEHVLHMITNHLRIGPLDFVLKFSVDNEEIYLASRNDYMRERFQNWNQPLMCDRLDPLPKPTQVRLRDTILHHTISQGGFGVVRVGVDRQSGDVVACKTIHLRHRDITAIKNEVDIASQILPDTTGLVPLLSSWCEHGQSPPCFQTAFEDIHLLMSYAPSSFQTTRWHETPLATRLALFHQVLEGLRNLHATGIMHRDISPNNLLVFSQQPPVAAICDFGKSKRGTKGVQTGLGPPAFTAPEVGRQEEYTNSIDIFSLGLSMLATFKRWEYLGPMSVPETHTRVLEHLASLQSRIPDDLGVLLRSMLAWDPADRPTAEQALAGKVWERITLVKPDPETQSSSGDSSGPGPSTTATRLQRSGGPSPSSSGGTNKRVRRSDAPAPSRTEIDSDAGKKTTRRPSSSGSGGREKRLRTSDSRSLISPPPA